MLNLGQHLLLAVVQLAGHARRKAQRRRRAQALRSGVARHNNHGIAEVHSASLPVRQSAILHNLQKQVENIRMSLLNLVQQHHAIRLTAYSVRQLTALLIAYIAGRRTNQPRCRVLFHILGHIKAQHSAFIAKKLRRQRLRQLRLANARRAEE